MKGRRRMLLVLTTLFAWSAGATPAKLAVSGAVAAGADDNLNGSTEGSEKVGAGYGQGTVGLALTAGPLRVKRSLGLHYRFISYPSLPTLSSHNLMASTTLFVTPKDWLSAMVAPRLGGRWVADPLLRSVSFGVGCSVIARPVERAAVRLGYDLSHVVAEDVVYGGTAHEVSADVELRVAQRTWIHSEYSFGAGPTVRYVAMSQASAAAGPGAAPASSVRAQTNSDLFGTDEVAVRFTSTSHAALVGFEQGFSDVFHLRGWGGASWTAADQTTATALFGQVALGFRVR